MTWLRKDSFGTRKRLRAQRKDGENICGSLRELCGSRQLGGQQRRSEGQRLLHVKQAQAREAGFFQEVALEVLLFEHGELVGGHSAAIEAELAVQVLTR